MDSSSNKLPQPGNNGTFGPDLSDFTPDTNYTRNRTTTGGSSTNSSQSTHRHNNYIYNSNSKNYNGIAHVNISSPLKEAIDLSSEKEEIEQESKEVQQGEKEEIEENATLTWREEYGEYKEE